jgi:hypothetical protein
MLPGGIAGGNAATAEQLAGGALDDAENKIAPRRLLIIFEGAREEFMRLLESVGTPGSKSSHQRIRCVCMHGIEISGDKFAQIQTFGLQHVGNLSLIFDNGNKRTPQE